MMGTVLKPNSILERLLYVAGGLMAFIPGLSLDLTGMGLIALGLVLERYAPPFPILGRRPRVKAARAGYGMVGGIGPKVPLSAPLTEKRAGD
jgi:hypothetical protein